MCFVEHLPELFSNDVSNEGAEFRICRFWFSEILSWARNSDGPHFIEVLANRCDVSYRFGLSDQKNIEGRLRNSLQEVTYALTLLHFAVDATAEREDVFNVGGVRLFSLTSSLEFLFRVLFAASWSAEYVL